MSRIGYHQFLKTLPTRVMPLLSAESSITSHNPYRWLLQFYDRNQDRRLHYEVQRIARRDDFELGLHFESKQKKLNAYLLQEFSRRQIAIRAELGDSIEVEPWDKGWSKVYEVFPGDELTEKYQAAMAARLAQIIGCLHPILCELLADSRRRLV